MSRIGAVGWGRERFEGESVWAKVLFWSWEMLGGWVRGREEEGGNKMGVWACCGEAVMGGGEAGATGPREDDEKGSLGGNCGGMGWVGEVICGVGSEGVEG